MAHTGTYSGTYLNVFWSTGARIPILIRYILVCISISTGMYLERIPAHFGTYCDSYLHVFWSVSARILIHFGTYSHSNSQAIQFWWCSTDSASLPVPVLLQFSPVLHILLHYRFRFSYTIRRFHGHLLKARLHAAGFPCAGDGFDGDGWVFAGDAWVFASDAWVGGGDAGGGLITIRRKKAEKRVLIMRRKLFAASILTVHCQKSHKSIETRTKSDLTHKISSDNAATVMNLNEAHRRFSVKCWPFWFCNYLRQTDINLNSRKCCIKLLPYLGGWGVHTLSTYMNVER